MRTWSVRWIGFSLLHILGTLAIPALIFLLTSCIKKDEELDNDGPEVSSLEVGTALVNAKNGKSLADSKTNDWILLETTQRIFTQDPETKDVFSKQIYSIADAVDPDPRICTDHPCFDFQILKSTYDATKSPPVVTNQNIEKCLVRKDGTGHTCEYASMVASSQSAGPDLRQANYSRLNSNNEIEPRASSVTYHNLSVVGKSMAPPKFVVDKPNCLDIPNCQIHVTTVEFDEITYTDGERTRYHHEIDFSTDVPFLGVRMRHCAKWNYKTENRYIPAEVCDKVINFEYGK